MFSFISEGYVLLAVARKPVCIGRTPNMKTVHVKVRFPAVSHVDCLYMLTLVALSLESQHFCLIMHVEL